MNESDSPRLGSAMSRPSGSRPPTTLYEQFKRMDLHETSDPPPGTQKNGKQVVTKEEAQKLRDSVLKANRPKNPYYEPLHSSAIPPKITIVPISPSPPTTKKIEEKPRRYSPLEVTPFKTVQERPSKVRHVDVPRSDSPRGARSIWDQVREEAAAVHMRELDLEADRQRRLAPFGGHSSTTDEFSSPSTYYFSDEGSTEEVEKAVDTRKNEEQTIVQRNEPPTCDRCKKHIHDMILQAIGENWHPSCFRCAECNRCLDGVPFAVDGQNHVFCMEDYERLFVPICARCERAIRPSNPYGQIVRVVAMDREYHVNCFSCEGCGIQLTNEESRRCFPIGDHLLCRECNNVWREFGGPTSPLTDL